MAARRDTEETLAILSPSIFDIVLDGSCRILLSNRLAKLIIAFLKGKETLFATNRWSRVDSGYTRRRFENTINYVELRFLVN